MIKKILTLFLLIFAAGAAFGDEGIEQNYNKKHKFHIFKIDTNLLGTRIKPYIIEDGLKTSSEVFKQNNFEFVVNGGFFDPVTQKSVSYVTVDSKEAGTPFESIEMIENLSKEGRVEKVLNRSELRIYSHVLTNYLKFDICEHFTPVPNNYEIKHVLGGGPMLHPRFNLEAEGFVAYDETGAPVFQSASVLKKKARTVIALKGKYLYVVIFTNFSPVTLSEAAQSLKSYRFDKVMALDGGPSTSVNYKDTEIFSSNDKQRAVKSFLIIQK